MDSKESIERLAGICNSLQLMWEFYAKVHGTADVVRAFAVVVGLNASQQEDPKGAMDSFIELANLVASDRTMMEEFKNACKEKAQTQAET